MAVGAYTGVSGVARKVKAGYVGVGGVARKIKTGYIGVGGVARKCYAGLDIKAKFGDNDWDTISAVSATGQAGTYWNIGDEKDITLSTGEVLTLAIMGFNHDDLTSGRKAGITLGLKNLMETTRQMNSSKTNVGGFTGSAMYTWLQGDLLKSMPSDLQAVLKSINKKTSTGNASSTINTNAMKIFLFSEVEVFGTTAYSAAGEGSQYQYFTTGENRTKSLANGSGSKSKWWLRSPNKGNNASFCYVGAPPDTTGSEYPDKSLGICWGCCV